MQATERTIVDSLPTRKQAIIAVATAKVCHYFIQFLDFLVISLNLKVLGHYAIDEVYLPNITSSHFGEEGAKKVYLNFREELLKVVSICCSFNVFYIPICFRRKRRSKRETTS